MMDEEMKYFIIAGIIVCMFMWFIVMTGCVSKSTYVMPDGTMIELPEAPTDSVKGGGR